MSDGGTVKEYFEKDAHGANKNLRRDVEAALHFDTMSGKVLPRRSLIGLSATPQILVENGLPDDANIITRVTHIRKLAKGDRYGHSLSVDEIVALPNHYNDPHSIFIDERDFLVMTDMKAKNKKGDLSPVMVVLTPRYGGKRDTFLASAYPIEDETKNHLGRLRRKGKLIYSKKNEPKRKCEDESLTSIITSHNPTALH